MKWLKITSLMIVYSFSFPVGSADNACSMAWKDLVADAAAVGQKSAVHIYSDTNSVILKSLRTWRGQLREFITRANGNRYPVMALDDGTPLKAYALARDGRSGLALESIPQGLEAIDLKLVKGEIDGLLKFVKSYQDDLLEIQLNAANGYARREALKKFLDENKMVTSGVHIEIPVLKWEKGELVYAKAHSEYFGQTTDVKNEITTLNRIIKKSTQNIIGPFDNNLADKRAVQQAISLKRLETYFKEIQHVESRLASSQEKLAEDVVKIKAKIKAIYLDPVKEKFKPDLSPPGVAWFRVRNIQLLSEIKVLFVKRVPEIGQKIESDKVFQAVKSMKVGDRKELFKQLGLNRVAQSASIIGKSGPATRIMALIGTPFAGGGLKWTYDLGAAFFFRKGTAKECARTEDDDQYAECLKEFVDKEFPGTQLKQYLNGQGMLSLETKTFNNPKVAEAIKSIQNARMTYLEEQNDEREKVGFFKAYAAKENPNSDDYQKKLASTNDVEVFKKRLIGPDKNYPNGLLGHKFPRGVREGKKILEELFTIEFGSEAFNSKVQQLSDINPDMRDLTVRMFELREYFLHPETAPTEDFMDPSSDESDSSDDDESDETEDETKNKDKHRGRDRDNKKKQQSDKEDQQ